MKIYLDMDGVIANFIESAIAVAKLPITHDKWTHWNAFEEFMTREEFEERIRSGFHFWSNLDAYPWAERLVDYLTSMLGEGDQLGFLTTPMDTDPTCRSGKVQWARHHFPGLRMNFSHNKADFACVGDVLIDDNENNIKAWEEAGGIGILFSMPWNSGVNKEDPVAGVTLVLDDLLAPVDRKSTLPVDAVARKAIPLVTGCLHYFPDALAEVAKLSKAGNDQHNPGQPLHWDRTKSADHVDCLGRHLLQIDERDTDGQLHATKVAWRALANLQVMLERGA